MYRNALLAALAAGITVLAAPLEKRADIDPTILNFALTLEHLENAFYKDAVQRFTQQDFTNAGKCMLPPRYSADYYDNLKHIAFDEQSHVQLLAGALQAAGVTPVQPCTYNFPYTDVLSFITLSSVLEGVGTSAYLGAASLVTSKGYLTVAGSILAIEALHTSYQRATLGEIPMANPLYTSLDPTSVFTLAAAFITSCPAGNPALPFTAFPSLAAAKNGTFVRSASCTSATFTAATDISPGSFVTFVSGLAVTSVSGTITGRNIKAAVPSSVSGQVYVFVSSSDVEGTFDDSKVLFGPAVLEVEPPAPKLT